MSNKIQLVVFNEHTLGYRDEGDKHINILQALVHKGANSYRSDGWIYPNATDTVRPANAKDFEEFRISMDGYRDDPRYEFDRG